MELALDTFKDRRCSTCTDKNKEDWGCNKDTQVPITFDGERIYRCPLRPFKDDPHTYSELFKLYNFREKNILPETGAYYDQPYYYTEAMLEMDSAMSDRHEHTESFRKIRSSEEDKKIDGLKNLGLNIQKK